MDFSIQNIISLYIKVPAEQIAEQTIIDRSAVSSSIMVHRMYAHLAKEGFLINNYWEIKNFGMLLQRLSGIQTSSTTVVLPQLSTTFNTFSAIDFDSPSIGIDMEQISLMPPAKDYREDDFYSMNFSQAEIAYCILQPNPLNSFTGLFAAKEAIVKADNQFINQPFHTIVIDHLPNGKPVHPHFSLTISHTADVAVAVALAIKPTHTPIFIPSPVEDKLRSTPNLYLLYTISLTAFLLSLLLLLLFIFKMTNSN